MNSSVSESHNPGTGHRSTGSTTSSAGSPHLQARNLSQFELDDVGMEGVTVIEAGPEADLDRGTVHSKRPPGRPHT